MTMLSPRFKTSSFEEAVNYIEYPIKDTPTPEPQHDHQHKVVWLKVTDDLWTAQHEGEYAGMVERLDKTTYTSTGPRAESLGVFDCLGRAKKSINEMFASEVAQQEKEQDDFLEETYRGALEFDYENHFVAA